MPFSTRIILALSLTLLFFATAFSSRSFAQTVTPNTYGNVNPYAIPETDPNVPKNTHTLTQSIFYDVLSGAYCLIVGVDPTTPSHQCLGPNQKTGKIGYVQQDGGAIGTMSNMIAALYKPPASSIDYLSYLKNSFGGQKADAANSGGYGFMGLQPFVQIWVTFRNIAYLVFILIFVVVGFAIMLRMKIDARTVMSIQNSLPKMVIAILLVTFSYAIAGFLIDMMWTSTYLVINVMSQASPKIITADATTSIKQDPIGFTNDLFGHNTCLDSSTPVIGGALSGTCAGGILSITTQGTRGFTGIYNHLLQPIAKNVIAPILTPILGFFLAGPAGVLGVGIISAIPLVGDTVNNAVGSVITFGLDAIAALVFWFIILLAILIGLFKLWFALLKAYVFILIDVMLAPFWFVYGTLPGQGSFTPWFKDMVANLLAFPAVIGMLMLGDIIMVAARGGQALTPPLIGSPDGSSLSAIIGVGFILSTPSVLDMIRKALKAPELPVAAMKMFGAGQAVAGAVAGAAWSKLYHPADQYHNAGVVRRTVMKKGLDWRDDPNSSMGKRIAGKLIVATHGTAATSEQFQKGGL